MLDVSDLVKAAIAEAGGQLNPGAVEIDTWTGTHGDEMIVNVARQWYH